MSAFRASVLSVVAVLSACGRDPSPVAYSYRVNDGAPVALAVFGDSIASGMFADTSLGGALTDKQAARFADLYQISKDEKPSSQDFYVEAQKTAAAPDASAFSGTASYSLATRVGEKTGKPVGIYRYAISGATSGTFPAQLDLLDQDNAKGLATAPFAVVNLGANDFCDRVTPDQFRGQIEQGLSRLLTALPQTKVLVVGIAPVANVMSLPDTKAFDALGLNVKCSDIRSTMSLCSERKIAPGADPASIKADVADVAALNDALAAAVKDLAAQPQFVGRLTFAPDDGPLPVADDLAIDCFHPGKGGHAHIADVVWPRFEPLLNGY